jgi:hemerythrin-like domain-containing protein
MPRFDLFTSIHKALRAMIYETSGGLQTTDFADEQGARRAVDALVPVLGHLQQHHDLEEEYVFPRVRPFEEAIIDDLQAQHDQVERLLGVAEVAVDAALSADSAARVGAGVDLNRRFNELTALFLEHLAHEEATLLPATWKHFDDAQLVAIQGAIIAAQQPDDLMQTLQWMFKGLNRLELVGMLGAAKATMPPPALDAVRQIGAASMEPAAWEVVRAEAGL